MSSQGGERFSCDELDLLLIGELVRSPSSTYKGLANTAGVDQRTVARRVETMKKQGVIRAAYEVNWEKLGASTSAIVGCTTSLGTKSVERLREYLKSDPRVIEGYESLGGHQYVFRVLGKDISDLRNNVLSELEPLTADLTASILSSEIKAKDYFSFVRYLRETRYPRTRTSWQ